MAETILKFTPASRDIDILLCPACGDGNAHIRSVIHAAGEDATGKIRGVTVLHGPADDRDDFGAVEHLDGSLRSNAVAITLWCENCTSISAISLENHKGNVYVTARVRKWETISEGWPRAGR